MVFEAVPDFEIPNYSAKLCRISIRNIGKGLPCLYHADVKSKEVYSKSEEAKLFDDYGLIEVGQLCPMNYPRGDASSNKFIAQVAYQFPYLPTGTTIQDVETAADYAAGESKYLSE